MEETLVPSQHGSVFSDREKFKFLWKRPEGILGIITGIGLFGAIGYGLYKILPFLIAAASNLIILGVEVFVIGLLLIILCNKKTWHNLSLIWYQINRAILGAIVDLDPISILQKNIIEMRKNADIVHEKITELSGIKIGMEKKLAEYISKFNDDTLREKELKKQLNNANLIDKDRLKLSGTKSIVDNDLVRGKERIDRQKERLKMSERYLSMMEKLEIVVNVKIDSAQSDLNYKKEEFEQAKKSREAMKSIMGVLKGNIDTRIDEELALAKINDTVNNSIAEMQRLIDGSNTLLVDFELDQGINESKAEELLKMYEDHGLQIFREEEPVNNDGLKKALSGRKKAPVLLEVEEAEVVEEKKANRYL